MIGVGCGFDGGRKVHPSTFSVRRGRPSTPGATCGLHVALPTIHGKGLDITAPDSMTSMAIGIDEGSSRRAAPRISSFLFILHGHLHLLQLRGLYRTLLDHLKLSLGKLEGHPTRGTNNETHLSTSISVIILHISCKRLPITGMPMILSHNSRSTGGRPS